MTHPTEPSEARPRGGLGTTPDAALLDLCSREWRTRHETNHARRRSQPVRKALKRWGSEIDSTAGVRWNSPQYPDAVGVIVGVAL